MKQILMVAAVAVIAFTAGAWAQGYIQDYREWVERNGLDAAISAEWNEGLTKDQVSSMLYNYHSRFHRSDAFVVTTVRPTTTTATLPTVTTVATSVVPTVPTTSTTTTTVAPRYGWRPTIEYATSDIDDGNVEQGYMFHLVNPRSLNDEPFEVIFSYRYYTEDHSLVTSPGYRLDVASDNGEFIYGATDAVNIIEFEVLGCEPMPCTINSVEWPGEKSTTTTVPSWEPIIEIMNPVPMWWENVPGHPIHSKYMAYRLKNQSEDERRLNIYMEYKYYSPVQDDGQIYIHSGTLHNEGCAAWLDEAEQEATGYIYQNCFGHNVGDIIEDGIRVWCEPIACRVELVDFIAPLEFYVRLYNFYR